MRKAKRVLPESYVKQWLDHNVGSGPSLDQHSAEARELAGELISDAVHAGYNPEDIPHIDVLAHMVAETRWRASGNSSDRTPLRSRKSVRQPPGFTTAARAL